MSAVIELRFENKDENDCLLPAQCNLSAACYDNAEVRHAVAVTMGDALYAIATTGLDLRALDGITMSHDCKNDAITLQQIPEGTSPAGYDRAARLDGDGPNGGGAPRGRVALPCPVSPRRRTDDVVTEENLYKVRVCLHRSRSGPCGPREPPLSNLRQSLRASRWSVESVRGRPS